MEKLKDVIREELESVGSKEEKVKTYLSDKLQQAYKYYFQLENINAVDRAEQEASNWLSKNRKKLVLNIENLILQGKIIPKYINIGVISRDKITEFCKNIDFYLLRIEHSIRIGDAPPPLPEGVIKFTIPKEAYVEVFKFIRNSVISTRYGLSEKAVERIQVYLDRFVIEPLL